MFRVYLLLALLSACDKKRDPNAPCADYNPLKNVYFGDLHVHTSYSFDAYDYGARSEPAAAYAFARGAKVDVAPGAVPADGQTQGPKGVKLDISGGKLDFMAVTDHAEFLSETQECVFQKDSPAYNDPFCQARRAHADPNFQDPNAPDFLLHAPCIGELANSPNTTPEICAAAKRTAWKEELKAATAAYDACNFTTFHAFEWSGAAIDVSNNATLHRNVFFANENVTAEPLDFVKYRGITKMWEALEAQCRPENGCEALTIPHNMNQSMGYMFDTTGFTADDYARMTRYQKLAEIHQHKGTSECLTDTADDGTVSACTFEIETGDDAPMSKPGYVRPALESGIAAKARGEENRLMLGFVGATDTHNATPGHVAEASWPGHTGVIDNTPALRLNTIAGQNPGGLTGAWAEQNTRESLWAALMRREVFATSGPRIKVRFYEYSGDLSPCDDPNFPAQIVAQGGVPMGGTFAAGPPKFVVYALQDQTALQAVDLVKASVVGGDIKERIYTVPLTAAPYCLTWSDPDFTAGAPAFYYARVREQPSPRWSHYDCDRLKQSNPSDWQTIAPGCASSDPKSGGQDVMIEERAWTSPIWYVP